MEGLRLADRALQEIRGALSDRIRAGLSRPGGEIAALPAWLPRPRPGQEGVALVLDTGGTRMRAAQVRLQSGGGLEIEAGPLEARVPTGRGGMPVSGRRFFEAQAELVAGLDPPDGLPLGYCFSYPAEITDRADARLLRWTKGVDIPEVVGALVGQGLGEALRGRGLRPGGIRVLNDTVAALLGGVGATSPGHSPDQDEGVIGLIVGTGTNMASFFPTSALAWLQGRGWGHPEMAVNLESGNFSPPHLTGWDDQLDASSEDPGRQRLEKAVSGRYLPQLFSLIMPGVPGFHPEQGAGALVDLRALGGRPGEVAGALLARSADLVAAGLAGLIDCLERRAGVAVVAEGSLFWGDPRFRPRVEETLGRLLGGGRGVRVLKVQDPNLVGAVAAALGPGG